MPPVPRRPLGRARSFEVVGGCAAEVSCVTGALGGLLGALSGARVARGRGRVVARPSLTLA